MQGRDQEPASTPAQKRSQNRTDVKAPGDGGLGLDPSGLLSLQRTAGNAAVVRLIQRHPAGAAPPIDVAGARQELETPPDLAEAPVTPAGTKTKKKPVKTQPKTMDAATAQAALQTAYGSTKAITTFTIVWLKNQADAWAQYDAQSIGLMNPNTTPPSPWKKGDAKKLLPGLVGWADAPNAKVYLLKTTDLPTATAHEMLHMNTAADFRGKVGEAINEGATEYLAIQALNKAGVKTSGKGIAVAYPDQEKMIEKLVSIIGEPALVNAYFNGAQSLIDAVDALEGPGSFAKLKDKGTLATGHADAVLKQKTFNDKINLIVGNLHDPPTDADVTAINAVWNSKPSDQALIRTGLPGIPGVTPTVEKLVQGHLKDTMTADDFEAIKKFLALPVTDAPALKTKCSPRIVELVKAKISKKADPADLAAIDKLCDSPLADLPAVKTGVCPEFIDAITKLLAGWVSDSDVEAIKRLAASKAIDLGLVGTAVSPKVKKLWSKKQRNAVSAALGI
jgi:hypothetical protein